MFNIDDLKKLFDAGELFIDTCGNRDFLQMLANAFRVPVDMLQTPPIGARCKTKVCIDGKEIFAWVCGDVILHGKEKVKRWKGESCDGDFSEIDILSSVVGVRSH